MKEKRTLARPWAWRWNGGYIISWRSLDDLLKGQDVVELKGVRVGAKPLRALLREMAASYHALVSVVEYHQDAEGNGDRPNLLFATPPFYGKGLQVEVGPEIQRTEDGRKRRWRKSDGRRFYSRIRVANGAWVKPKDGQQVVRVQPRSLSRDRS